jgi:hypothetical protein
MARAEHQRREVRYWGDSWPEELGPTWVIPKKPPPKPAGRPRTSIQDLRRFLRLRIATSAYEVRGEGFEASIIAAMTDLDWPDQSAAEVDRIRKRFQRARPARPR